MKRKSVLLLMCLYSVSGFCQIHYTDIGVEPLKEQGARKVHSYPAIKAGEKGRAFLWKLVDVVNNINNSSSMEGAIEPGKQVSIRFDGDSLRFPSSAGLNSVMLTPIPKDENKGHTIWLNDTLLFNIPEEQNTPKGCSIMLWAPSQLQGSKSFMHLTGMLHIKLNSEIIASLANIEIIVDSDKALSGLFAVDINGTSLKLKEIIPAYSVNVGYEDSSADVYVPVSPGTFKDLKVVLLDHEGNDICDYNFTNVCVDRGCVTTLSLTSKDKTFSCNRTKIKKFCVDTSFCDWPEVEETRNPSPVKAQVVFDENAVDLFRVSMTGFHWLPQPHHTLYRHYIKSQRDLKNEMDVYGNITVDFDNVELFPGHNAFFRTCSSPTIKMSLFVHSKKRVINLFLPTYTCCFDYKEFARSDSLCSSIPEWDIKKWRAPVVTAEWKFSSEAGKQVEGKLHPYQIADPSLYPKDNHYRIPLRDFWERITIDKEGYHIVLPGTVEYQLSSRYVLPDRIHKEKSGEKKKFTTDIISFDNAKRQSDGSVIFTGSFNEGYVKSFCEDIKFSPSYFNGFERGVIVIEKEKYRGNGSLPHDIARYKHLSSIKSGAEWKCSVKNLEKGKEYYVWTYLLVNGRLFLSGVKSSKEFSKDQDNKEIGNKDSRIFEKWPQLYKPFVPELLDLSSKYIDAYRKVNGTTGYVPTMKAKREAEKVLMDKCREIAKSFGEDSCDVTPFFKTIPYTVEGELPYTIEGTVNKAGILLPYAMFEPDENKPKEGDVIKVNFFRIRKGTILKQYPLVFMAYIDFKIKIKRIDSNIINIYAYVPGSGPDGKRLGYVDPISYASEYGSIGGVIETKGKKVGDIIQVGAFIYGWGTPEMLDSMKSLTFTSKDYDADRRKVVYQTTAKFPNNPLIDWMDEWYDRLKIKYKNRR